MGKRRSAMLCHFLLAVCVFVSSEEPHAQDLPFKKGLFAKFGYGTTGEDEGSLGNGILLGGGVGFQVTQRWEVAFEVDLQKNELSRGPGQFFSEGHSLSVGGSALYHLSRTRVQPFLRIGISYTCFNGSKGFAPDDPARSTDPPDPGWRREGAQNFLGPEFGAGLKIFATDRICVRPEFRFLAGGSGGYDPSTDVIEPGLFLTSVTIGVGYQW